MSVNWTVSYRSDCYFVAPVLAMAVAGGVLPLDEAIIAAGLVAADAAESALAYLLGNRR